LRPEKDVIAPMHETDEPTAATEAELRAAEALADEARSEGARSITELNDTSAVFDGDRATSLLVRVEG